MTESHILPLQQQHYQAKRSRLHTDLRSNSTSFNTHTRPPTTSNDRSTSGNAVRRGHPPRNVAIKKTAVTQHSHDQRHSQGRMYSHAQP